MKLHTRIIIIFAATIVVVSAQTNSTRYAQAQKPTAQQIRESLWLTARVQSVATNGLFVTFNSLCINSSNEAMRVETDQLRWLVNFPDQNKVAEGDGIKFRAYRNGVQRFEDGQRTLQQWVYCGPGRDF